MYDNYRSHPLFYIQTKTYWNNKKNKTKKMSLYLYSYTGKKYKHDIRKYNKKGKRTFKKMYNKKKCLEIFNESIEYVELPDEY